MRIDTAATLARLLAHRAELEAMGVRHLAFFGSQARGEADDASDIDVAVVFDEAARAEGLAYLAQQARTCIFGRLGERLANGSVG